MANLDYAKSIFSVRELLLFGLAFIVFTLCLQVILFLIYGLFYECYCTVACTDLHYKECLGEENYTDNFLNSAGDDPILSSELFEKNKEYRMLNASEIEYLSEHDINTEYVDRLK